MTKQERGFSNKDTFKEAVRSWAATLNVKPSQIRVQRMTNKWASCSLNRTVTFSEDLLKEHREFQKYVIVHELLHLRVRNHGKLFRSLLSLYLPGWEDWAKHASAASTSMH
jgi:predicted metal-dependent hydrolase